MIPRTVRHITDRDAFLSLQSSSQLRDHWLRRLHSWSDDSILINKTSVLVHMFARTNSLMVISCSHGRDPATQLGSCLKHLTYQYPKSKRRGEGGGTKVPLTVPIKHNYVYPARRVCLKASNSSGPMTISRGSLSSLSDVESRPVVVPSQWRCAGPSPVIIKL